MFYTKSIIWALYYKWKELDLVAIFYLLLNWNKYFLWIILIPSPLEGRAELIWQTLDNCFQCQTKLVLVDKNFYIRTSFGHLPVYTTSLPLVVDKIKQFWILFPVFIEFMTQNFYVKRKNGTRPFFVKLCTSPVIQ